MSYIKQNTDFIITCFLDLRESISQSLIPNPHTQGTGKLKGRYNHLTKVDVLEEGGLGVAVPSPEMQTYLLDPTFGGAGAFLIDEK